MREGLCRKGRAEGGAIRRMIALPVLTGFMALLLLLPAAPASNADGYHGVKKCAGCHDAIIAKWAATRHGTAFESLKKSGQENLPKCVACHVTGYEKTGGFIDYELTPELAGVQCEECHGPAGKHVEAPGKGSMTAKPGEAACRRCHTPGQDPKFDYTKKVRNIH